MIRIAVRKRRDGRLVESVWRSGDAPPVLIDKMPHPEFPAQLLKELRASKDDAVRAAAASYRTLHPIKYRAVEDDYIDGVWLASPVGYTGRGVVYLFHPPNAEALARAFVKIKNGMLP